MTFKLVVVASTMSGAVAALVGMAVRRLKVGGGAVGARVGHLSAPIARRGDGAGSVVPPFRAEMIDGSPSSLARVLTVGVFAIAMALALAVAAGRHERSSAQAASSPQSFRASASADAVPLELIALDVDRDSDRITVRGVVRLSRSASMFDQLAAVVFLFDRDGALLEKGDAVIRPAPLPGADSTFVFSTGRAADVGRYRVSFRNGDHIIRHVDHRRPSDPMAALK